MIHLRASQSLVFIFFSSTQRNVPELMSTETIIHILLILLHCIQSSINSCSGDALTEQTF